MSVDQRPIAPEYREPTWECTACGIGIRFGESALRVQGGLLCESCQTAERRCILPTGHAGACLYVATINPLNWECSKVQPNEETGE